MIFFKAPSRVNPKVFLLAELITFLGFFIFTLGFLCLRYWLLPNIDNYRTDIARTISQASGERIVIGKIDADWQGLYPHLAMTDIGIYDKTGILALSLDRIDSTISWLSIPTFELRFHSLEISEPKLGIRQDPKGTLYAAGIELNSPSAPSTLSDWLLHQNSVTIKNGLIVWEDDKANAPPLILEGVSLAIANSGNRHRFGLKATPPPEISSPIDARGDFYGKSLNNLDQWRGTLYGKMDRADTSVWKTWFPVPEELIEGNGSVRFWLDFEHKNPTAVTLDLGLSRVKARLARNLPQINISKMQGRISWAKEEEGFEISTKKFSLTTEDGQMVHPMDLYMQSIPSSGKKSARGEIRADSLDIGTLYALAEHFPLPAETKDILLKYAPEGKIYDLQAKWGGDKSDFLLPWRNPQPVSENWSIPKNFSLKGRFADLGLRTKENRISRLSGNVSGDESGGSFNLDSRQTTLLFPGSFAEPVLLDTLTAQGKWAKTKDSFELSFSNLSFANPDVAGNAFGSLSPSFFDLNGNLSRVDLKSVWRYLPLYVNRETRDWIHQSFLSGISEETHVRLKGNLNDFPFASEKAGIFQFNSKIKNGSLRFAERWPTIESINAEIFSQGKTIEINTRDAMILGAKVGKTKAVVSNLDNESIAVDVEGNASGPTNEFFQFIDKSPVSDYINRLTENMKAQGNGELKLKLKIPLVLAKMNDIKMAGSYHFLNNVISGPQFPDLEQVNAQLHFTESAITAQNASARILGGPATLNASTQQDGTIRVTVAGRANFDGPKKASSIYPYLHGKSDWKGLINIRKKRSSLLIESSLQGISSDLPAPFSKTFLENMPLRLEKKETGPDRDLISFNYGKTLSAQFVKSEKNGVEKIDRGSILINSAVTPPDRSGIWLYGSLPGFNADQWHDILNQGGEMPMPFSLAGAEIKIGSLTFFGKRFGEMKISARNQENQWLANISGSEVNGDIHWLPNGKGQLIARLKTLSIPVTPRDKVTEVAAVKIAIAKVAEKNLPSLDVMADNFVINDIPLGHLELLAVQQARDWRIEKLKINNPESTLLAEGFWHGWAQQPKTNIKLKLDVSNIGKLLTRLGYPEGMKMGNGKLEGELVWLGSPQSINYPSLSGSLSINASHGQFSKIEPGIGKLLGILSLQALPRRITLDFRDIFSEGFAFDDISGNLKIINGTANTQNLKLTGPAADVKMTGDVDLARETQNLYVAVTPKIGDSVSVASSILGGPIVGIATWVVGKVLHNPLDQLASYEYNITGSWDEPNVTKIGKK